MMSNTTTTETNTKTGVVKRFKSSEGKTPFPYHVYRSASEITEIESDYIFVSDQTDPSSGVGHTVYTTLSLESLMTHLSGKNLLRAELVLTPETVTPFEFDESVLVRFHDPDIPVIMAGEEYECTHGQEVHVDLMPYVEDILAGKHLYTLNTSSNYQNYMVTFFATGERAPYLEIEYVPDKAHVPTQVSLSMPSGASAHLDACLGLPYASFPDGVAARSPVSLTLSHAYANDCGSSAYGAGFTLSLDEKLKESDEDGFADYIYTDAYGESVGFYESFYYVDQGGSPVVIDKDAVVADLSGALSTTVDEKTYTVTRVLRSSSGWEAVTRIEDVKGVARLDQRSEDEAKLEEEMKSYKAQLCSYVTVSRENGIVKEDKPRLTDPVWEDAERLAPEEDELLLPISDAFSYRSLCLQRESLNAQITSYDLQSASYNLQKAAYQTQIKSLHVGNALNQNTLDSILLQVEDYNATIESIIANANGASVSPSEKEAILAKKIPYEEKKENLLEQYNYLTQGVTGVSGSSQSSLNSAQIENLSAQIALIEDTTDGVADFKDTNTAQKANAVAQLALCEEQIAEMLARAESYYGDFQALLLAYLKTAESLSSLRRQQPVSYLKKDGIIKGFNENGYLVAVFDAHEHVVAIERDDAHRVTRVYDDKGNEATLHYENGKLSELVDVYGERVSYAYTGDKLASVRYADGTLLSFAYDGNARLLSVTSSGDASDCKKTSFTYGAYGRVASVTHASTKASISHGASTEGEVTLSQIALAYGERETTVTDEENETEVIYRFDTHENLLEYYKVERGLVAEAEKTERDYESERSETVYTAVGTALYAKSLSEFDFESIVDIRESVTEYNGFHLPSRQTVLTVSPLPDTFFDGIYNESSRTDVSYTYDARRRLIKKTSELYRGSYFVDVQMLLSEEKLYTFVTSYTYDSLDRPTRTEEYYLGKELTEGKTVKETVYDESGREKQSVLYNSLSPASKLYTFSDCDEGGRVTAEYDETGRNKTILSYAPDGSLLSRSYPDGSVIAYGASPDGRSTSVTLSTEEGEESTNVTHYTAGEVSEVSCGDSTVRYTYDGKRRLTGVTLNGQPYMSCSYVDDFGGGLGKLSTVTYANDTKSFETLELSGKWTDVTYGGTSLVSEQRTADGRLLTRNNETYTYDAAQHLTGVSGNGVTTEAYTYDADGRVTSYSVTPAGETNATSYAYTYDSVTGKLLSTAVDGISISPKLDMLGRNAGKVVTVGEDDLFKETVSYLKHGDRATNLPSTLSFKAANKTDTLSYVYDKMGNICEIRENGRVVARYAYDVLGRLVREDNRPLGKTETVTYDRCGNIVSKRVYPFSLKPADELEEISFTDEKLYTYDGDRMLSFDGEICVYDAIGNPTTYRGKSAVWECARRLKSFDGNTFSYDGLGRRTAKNGITFTYDHNGNLLSQSNGLEFLYDHTGVFALKHNGSTYFYRKNAQGDVIALLDSTGETVVEYRYDAWGKCVIDASTINTELANINPFRYRSYYFDTETGLYFLKTRYYDPETGRFLNADAIDYLDPDTINGLNLYAYCFNNPVMLTDSYGCTAWWEWLIAGVVVAGLIVGSVFTGGLLGAAFVGAAIGAGVSLGSQAIFDGQLNWGQFALDIGVGAITGLLGVSSISRIGSMFAGAGISGAANIASQLIGGASFSEINWLSFGISVAGGAISGLIAGAGTQNAKAAGSSYEVQLAGKMQKNVQNRIASGTYYATTRGMKSALTQANNKMLLAVAHQMSKMFTGAMVAYGVGTFLTILADRIANKYISA